MSINTYTGGTSMNVSSRESESYQQYKNTFSRFCATSGDLGHGNLDITNHLCLISALSRASAPFPAILHQKLQHAADPKSFPKEPQANFSPHDRCKIWSSVGTKVCEKALGGGESDGSKVADKKRQTVTCDSVLLCR